MVKFLEKNSVLENFRPNVPKQAVLLERKACLCHVPIVWLAVEITENIVVLDYSAWIITILGVYLSIP